MSDFLNILTDIRDTQYPDIVAKHTEVEADRAEVATNTAIVASDKAIVEGYKNDAQTAKTSAETISANVTTAVNTFVNTTVPAKEALLQTQVDTATAQATIATTKASEANASATTAITEVAKITSLNAQALTLSSGSQATAEYNPSTGRITIGVPQGAKGDKGDSFEVNAVGTFASRSLYDAQQEGFSFVATDTGDIYFKVSNTSGDWSDAIPFGKGDTGNGIVSITWTASTGTAQAEAGETDTYTITYTDTTTDTFTVKNGIVPTKADLGLDNVDNTSDADKPISTATQSALALKADQSSLDNTNSTVATKLNATNPSITGSITEEVYTTSSSALDIVASNGTIQYWTLTGNSTATVNLSAGQSVTLLISGGSSYTVTWTGITWLTDSGSAPTLHPTNDTCVVLVAVGANVYGFRAGDGG